MNYPDHGRAAEPGTEPPDGPGEQPRTHSGENLPEAELSEQPPPAEQASSGGPGSFPCPRCERINSLDSDYCYACGMPLEDARTHAQAGAVLGAFDVNHPEGFLIRLVAYIVDLLVCILVFGTTLGVLTMSVLGMDETSAGEWISSYTQPLVVLYFAVLVAIWRTTVGKRLFGLYVVRSDGSRVGPGRALVRALAMILSGLILSIGYLMILFRDDNRGLHDLICDTVVVSRKAQ